MVIRVGSGTNELPSTMIRFSTRIKSLHILGNFSGRVWRCFDKLPCSLKSLFGSCLFTHDGTSTSNKEFDGFKFIIQQQFVTPARFADRGMPGHGLSTRSQIVSPSVQNRNWNGTPARVEAETWKFAHQRGCSRALGTRGLYVQFGTTTQRTFTRLHRQCESRYVGQTQQRFGERINPLWGHWQQYKIEKNAILQERLLSEKRSTLLITT